ncbi:tyrosine-type recombinase/integrase [Pelagibacterium sp. H642]|uniref:tyrosine-type recombinase/integrase n=1 Tax=Pelagibacterium sp. H642 TaxID=1881069 RepID=UPI0028155E05|nr:tyrosine-type recombinase/integrase [Pelagibacterium sp. H642]WMT89353.1 site-specific integrase [Pelagibacterium sp. H642]
MNWKLLIERLEGAYSTNTIRGYKSDFEQFATWCRRKRLRALPAEPATIAKFVDEHSDKLKASTIKRKLVAISKLHRLAGYASVADAEEVLLAVRRVKRARPGRPRQALGITYERREKLMAQCCDDLIGLRDRVLVAVGFDTLCRRSELVALRVEDFQLNPGGTMSVLVRRAKNDPEGLGRVAHLSRETTTVVQDWLATTQIERGPLLRPIYKSKAGCRYLSPSVVGRVLKRLSAQAYNADLARKVSGHSLRVGAAQTLTARGVGLLPIMSAGGWKSANIVARYVENVDQNLWQ